MKGFVDSLVLFVVALTLLQTVIAGPVEDVFEIGGLALFALALLLATVFVAFLIKEFCRKMNCFKNKIDEPEPDNVYDEVEESLRISSLPAPTLPRRPVAKIVSRLRAPTEDAPSLPEEPEYIIPEDPAVLALAAQKSSHPPIRPSPKAEKQQAANVKKANASTEEPDYLAPKKPGDSLDADGYLKPFK